MNDAQFQPKKIRSFVKRSGRTTRAQIKAIQTIGSKFTIPYKAEILNLDLVFEKTAPVILEIGFGMGEATAHIAQVLANENFLCCEVHEAGVGSLLKRIDEQTINNIKIIAHDAVDVAETMLADESLAGIHIFFPDPWHKKRHHKRRLIQTPFVELLCKKLKHGGYLHCATDWEPYAQHMLDVLSNSPHLKNRTQQTDGFSITPHYRPQTKFEHRGIRLGHGVWDIIFERI